jgi:hypothetical protein
MSIKQNVRGLVVAAVLCLVAAGCSHNSSASAQFNQGFAPFSSVRNYAVALVANTKRSLGAEDVNTLDLAYTSLQEKANAYASFMVEAVTTSSFDPAKNAEYAADLGKAITAFNRAFAGLEATHQTTIASAWVPSFAQNLQSRWNQYSGLIAKMTPQMKGNLIAALKRNTVWPNYEDIATEPLVGSR